MRIQHNILAMNAYRNYNTNTSALAKNLEKLSSGYKINRAGDDAAGLAISEKMRAQIKGLEAAQKNVKDGTSLVKTAEGAMQEIQDMLGRMKYLATQSSNGTYDNEVDRKALQDEVEQLKSEINRIADSANFNGIKLLDGSLDAERLGDLDEAGAISNITSEEFSPTGRAEAFKASYVTNRPQAAAAQTDTSFEVRFDDVAISASTTANTSFKVTIGGKEITVNTGAKTALTGTDIAAAVATSGRNLTAPAAGAANDTAAWKTLYDAATDPTTSGTAANKYIEIDGHYYEMSATNDVVAFTQVDEMPGQTVNPDFEVKMGTAPSAGDAKITGTTNWQVQKPVQGVGVGATHQAQVSVDIDFSKLKDGDTLTAGDMNYVFKLDSNNGTTDSGATKVIDLTSIFKEESDIQDAGKQAEAIAFIAKTMGDTVATGTTTLTSDTATQNDTWSVGNGGVKEGVGTLTFQSLSIYDGDTDDTHAANIGGNANNGVCDMRTEASVMKQFYATSTAKPANVSFELDVTKLKAGDTVTIDGTTFEFCDGSVPSDKANIVIDLSAEGIANGLLSSQTGDVLAKLKTAINDNLNYGYAQNSATLVTKYDVSVDGNKITLGSKDNSSTDGVKEDRVLADVKLPDSAYTSGKALQLQIGDTSDEYNILRVSVSDMHTKALGIADLDISNPESASSAIQTVMDAINSVSSTRGTLGAIQNRLDHTSNNLSVMVENITDAESTIRDTDVAEEMMAYTKNNILVQSAQAMLAQANAVPQGVLQLLG